MAETKTKKAEIAEVVETEAEVETVKKDSIIKKGAGAVKQHWKSIALVSGGAIAGFFVGNKSGFKKGVNSVVVEAITDVAEEAVEAVADEL